MDRIHICMWILLSRLVYPEDEFLEDEFLEDEFSADEFGDLSVSTARTGSKL